MFFNYLVLFLKMYLFRLQNFFSSSTYKFNSILSVVVRANKIYVFQEGFYPICNCWYDNWCLSPISLATVVKETNSFNKTVRLINSIYLKNGVKQIKFNQEKLLQSCIFYPSNGSKNYFFGFLLTFITQMDLICLACLIFHKLFDGQFEAMATKHTYVAFKL